MVMKEKARENSLSAERGGKSIDGGASIESRLKSLDKGDSPLGAYTTRKNQMASSVKQLPRDSSRKSLDSLGSLRRFSVGLGDIASDQVELKIP